MQKHIASHTFIRGFVRLMCQPTRKSLIVLGAVISFAILSMASSLQAQDIRLTLKDTENGNVTTLTDQDLAALPQHRFSTSTPWNSGYNTYSGPSLRDVLALLAPVGNINSIQMMAANDYAVDMPPAMITRTMPIIANRFNDAPFSLREKGPLWIIFPFDASAEMQSDAYYSRSIWQLTVIEVGTQ